MIDINDVATFISSADAETTRAIQEMAHDRTKYLRDQASKANAATLRVGDTVELHSISPKYMVGAKGTVVGKRGSKFEVKLEHSAGRFSDQRPITVPAGCVRKVA